ncbi:hypothetical protein B0H11DRAFT_421519 [Mycena galericulata]|nr:hypothetical protein B0H11DRAFT_421519 [Mycena galericulata]
MSSPNPGSLPEAARNPIHSRLLSSDLEWTVEANATAPPAYTRYEALPPYEQRNRDVERGRAAYGAVPCYISYQESEIRRVGESNQQQELQLLLGALFSVVITLLLMEAVPMLGEPTSSIHAIRMYGWFALALSLSIFLVAVSLLCKCWLTVKLNTLLLGEQSSERYPETKFHVFKKYTLNRLVAFGSILMWCCFGCFGVGCVDFFWQLYPSLGRGIATVCGIYGSGPVLSSFSRRPLCTSVVRETWQSARKWTLAPASLSRTGNTGDLRRAGEESLEH